MELEIGKRFKSYEAAFWPVLPPRIPVIVRLDGRSFHSLTKRLGVDEPFDLTFSGWIVRAAEVLCREFNPVVAYLQSDEVSLLLLNDREHSTQPLFGNDLCKVVSISAAIMSSEMSDLCGESVQFDSRTFVVPVSDVVNYFVWRQIDCLRNARNSWSENALGRLYGVGTARNRLSGLSGEDRVKLAERDAWSPLDPQIFASSPRSFRFGVLIHRPLDRDVRGWTVDLGPPWFSDDRDAIQRHIDGYYADKVMVGSE